MPSAIFFLEERELGLHTGSAKNRYVPRWVGHGSGLVAHHATWDLLYKRFVWWNSPPLWFWFPIRPPVSEVCPLGAVPEIDPRTPPKAVTVSSVYPLIPLRKFVFVSPQEEVLFPTCPFLFICSCLTFCVNSLWVLDIFGVGLGLNTVVPLIIDIFEIFCTDELPLIHIFTADFLLYNAKYFYTE